jgi:glycerophosphoryl diester phosphodiesterase
MMKIPTPCVFAHRGASGSAPENTLSSFELALKVGAHAIELDAKLSSDGKIMVIHDQTLDRTTTGSGQVHQTTAAAIKTLDAGSWFSSDYTNERVPFLAEVLESIGDKMIINIEVTNYRTWWDDLPEKIASLVQQFRLRDSIIFSSFHPRQLWKIRSLIPDAQTALLTEPHLYSLTTISGLAKVTSPTIQHPHLSDLSKERIQRAHKKSIRLHAWTVNQEADMRRLMQWGIDGIFTDHPAVALLMIDSVRLAAEVE